MRAAPSPRAPRTTSARRPREDPVSDALSILIVDDDPTNLEYLSALVDALGYTVETASSGTRGARSGWRSRRAPDVVVLDVHHAASSTASRRCAAIARAAARRRSSCARRSTRPTRWCRAMRAGATDYITKPFNAEELREILERVAGGQRATARHAGRAAARRGERDQLGVAARRCARSTSSSTASPTPTCRCSSPASRASARTWSRARSTRARRAPDACSSKINCAALPGELLECGAVRPRARLVHRRAEDQARSVRAGRRRHPVPRRDRRDAGGDAGQAAAGAAGRRVLPRRRPAQDQGRHARHRRHQRRPRQGDGARHLPRGPLLSTEPTRSGWPPPAGSSRPRASAA